jgi:hypothetical protein
LRWPPGVYRSLWDWTGKPAKNLCLKRKVSDSGFIDCKAAVDSSFSEFLPLLSAVRNGVFHTKTAAEKEWVVPATKLLFEAKVPQRLRGSLYKYGYDLNVAANNAGIYSLYPGIGGFGAVNPAGHVLPMSDLFIAGTNVKITPDPVWPES